MSRAERILKRLLVEPGTSARLRERDPGLERGQGVRTALCGEAKSHRQGHPEERREGPLGRARAPMGERHVGVAGGLPGVGRRR
jgi:hypothetical protein